MTERLKADINIRLNYGSKIISRVLPRDETTLSASRRESSIVALYYACPLHYEAQLEYLPTESPQHRMQELKSSKKSKLLYQILEVLTKQIDSMFQFPKYGFPQIPYIKINSLFSKIL